MYAYRWKDKRQALRVVETSHTKSWLEIQFMSFILLGMKQEMVLLH
jgi:hypothetical protein